ncbi:MAG: hypothetical protein MUE52_13920 [Tabrizicola sp.]|nr:hypothetical protein [Tabrizicola sp.]
MTKRKPEPTPIEAFLAPLARHASRNREIEGLVFWGGAGGWDPTPSEALEAEEIAFYAEGLLEDGFRMRWTLMASAATPDLPDHIRLEFWQDDSPPPPLPAGWRGLESAHWTGEA